MNADNLVEQYRRLVSELLEHGWIEHEGTEQAIADYFESDDRTSPILGQIIYMQHLRAGEESSDEEYRRLEEKGRQFLRGGDPE